MLKIDSGNRDENREEVRIEQETERELVLHKEIQEDKTSNEFNKKVSYGNRFPAVRALSFQKYVAHERDVFIPYNRFLARGAKRIRFDNADTLW